MPMQATVERRSAVVTVPENLVDLLTKHLKDAEDQAKSMENSVAKGIEAGMKALANDDEFVTKFWSTGYCKLSNHAGEAIQKSLGKRMLAALGGLLFTVAVWAIAKSGKI